jgi:hypothetical protein
MPRVLRQLRKCTLSGSWRDVEVGARKGGVPGPFHVSGPGTSVVGRGTWDLDCAELQCLHGRHALQWAVYSARTFQGFRGRVVNLEEIRQVAETVLG